MISREEILNLAQLARLSLSEEEIVGLQRDISRILEYVGQVSAVSAQEIQEIAPVYNVLRPDTERESTDSFAGKREALLAALPKREGDYNVVRKIIQKDE